MTDLRKNFSKIYDQYINKIYRFIFLKVSSKEIAQDLSSETFLRGWKSFKKGDKIDNPQAFLYRIARNLVTDHYREKAKTQLISADYVNIVDPRTNSEEKAILSSDIDTVKIALADLKDDYQNLIIWRYLDGLSTAKIAKMTNKSKPAVRVQLHRALKSLKTKLS